MALIAFEDEGSALVESQRGAALTAGLLARVVFERCTMANLLQAQSCSNPDGGQR